MEKGKVKPTTRGKLQVSAVQKGVGLLYSRNVNGIAKSNIVLHSGPGR